MKKILNLFFVVLCFGCYDDDLTIIEDSDDALHNSSELTALLRGVSSHNTIFDQFIDGSTCFSIEFPYKVKLEDNHILELTNKEELAEFASQNHQNYEFLYPLQIKTADYTAHQVAHKNQHLDLLTQCKEGLLFKNHIDCAELIYPIQLKVAFTKNNRFEQRALNDAEALYNFLSNLSDDVRFEIKQPIDLFLYQNEHYKTTSNAELLALILEASSQNCDVID
ncbi:hypothetical protein [Psychroflexus maritimus]|uniref:Uncharacterized protein n=1 Tax=Psychroflexus maritimus TaxID=2714865 RepID=A0A967ADV6_9FLAO|nr:hypothetical protein [Psychroflexus maritimus]NGZ89798.1 hypothetical protein [Psychroflexus maritimus]